MIRLKKEKGYRLGDLFADGRRIIELIPLRYLGDGRHQVKTDSVSYLSDGGHYFMASRIYLDHDFMSKNSIYNDHE